MDTDQRRERRRREDQEWRLNRAVRRIKAAKDDHAGLYDGETRLVPTYPRWAELLDQQERQ